MAMLREAVCNVNRPGVTLMGRVKALQETQRERGRERGGEREREREKEREGINRTEI